MQPIIIKQSRKRWLLLLGAGLAFVSGGVLLALQDPRMFLPWTVIVFFGGCSLVFGWQVLDNRPRIVITDEGIYDRTLKVGCIQWFDIEDVSLRWQQGNAFLGLILRDERKYTDRLSPLMRRMIVLNRKLGYPALSLNFAGTNAIPERVETLLRQELQVRVHSHAV